jgi:UDP-glucose 4-epimerase
LQAAAGKRNEVRVFGDRYPTKDGTALRDYVHVTDLAEGHVKALQYLRGGGESQFLNLGTGQGQSVLQVIEKARQVTGRELRIRIEQPRPGDPAVLIADAGKAKAILGWEPANSDLQRILKSAWDWNLQHPHGYAAS